MEAKEFNAEVRRIAARLLEAVTPDEAAGVLREGAKRLADGARRRTSPIPMGDIMALRRAGMTYADIAMRVGMTRALVRYYAVKAGAAKVGPGAPGRKRRRA